MKKFAIGNEKGGVGKTTMTLNLGYGIARKDRSVTLIDMDPQASLTKKFNLGSRYNNTKDDSLADILSGSINLEKINDLPVRVREDLDLRVIPSNRELKYVSGTMKFNSSKQKNVQDALQYLKSDYVLIDVPPSGSSAAYASYIAGEKVLIVIQADKDSIEAVNSFTDDMMDLNNSQVFEDVNISFVGVLPNQVDTRRKADRKYLEKLQERYEEMILNPIKYRVDIRYAKQEGKALYEYKKDSDMIENIENVVKVLMGDDYVEE